MMEDRIKQILKEPKARTFKPENKSARFNELLETSYEASRKDQDWRNQTVLSIKNLADFTKERTALKIIGTPNLNTTKIKTENSLSRITSNTKKSNFSKRRVSLTNKKQH